MAKYYNKYEQNVKYCNTLQSFGIASANDLHDYKVEHE